MEIWLRAGQWDTRSRVLTWAGNGVSADRALYRSSMVLATQQQGGARIDSEVARMNQAANGARESAAANCNPPRSSGLLGL